MFWDKRNPDHIQKKEEEKDGGTRDKDGLTRLNVSKRVGPTIEFAGV
jgi:hypothetical protein